MISSPRKKTNLVATPRPSPTTRHAPVRLVHRRGRTPLLIPQSPAGEGQQSKPIEASPLLPSESHAGFCLDASCRARESFHAKKAHKY